MTTRVLLTERETAEQLGISARTLRRLRADGKVGFVQFGRRILFRPEDVDALLVASYVPPVVAQLGGRVR